MLRSLWVLGLVWLSQGLGQPALSVDTLEAALQPYAGARYRWGGNSVWALDCSALVQQVYRRLGYRLPRTALQQYRALPSLAGGQELQPGDLLFFSSAQRPIDHVGIYLGQGWMMHASARWGRVVQEPVQRYRHRWVGVRRVVWPLMQSR